MNIEKFPDFIYHNEECYRTVCHPPYIAFLGCGFLTKEHKTIDWEYGTYPHFAWVYVLRGRGVLTDDEGQKHNLKPGMIFIRRTDRKMALEIDPDSQWAECFLSLKFCKCSDEETIGRLTTARSLRTAWIEDVNRLDDSTTEVLGFLHALPTEGVIYNPGLKLELLNRFSDMCLELKVGDIDEPADMILKLISLIESFTRKEQLTVATSSNKTIREICQRLSTDLQDRQPVPQLIEGVGLGYSRIRSLFKSVVGISPGEYRIQRRIEEAGKLLQEGYSVKQVAMKLGYKDQFTFATQFRKYTGITPSKFTRNRKM